MKTIVLFCLFLIPFQSVYAQDPLKDGWKLNEKNEKMKIYTRLTETSKFKELKMEVDLEANIDDLMDYISDASLFPKWIYTCMEAYSFDTQDGRDIYYIRFDMMWPIDDRDIVQYSVTTKDPNTGVIDIATRSVKGYVPEKKHVVRVPENRIKWKIIPLGDKKTKIHYYAINDPGGMIPAWMMNMFVSYGPKNTMQNLIDALE